MIQLHGVHYIVSNWNKYSNCLTCIWYRIISISRVELKQGESLRGDLKLSSGRNTTFNNIYKFSLLKQIYISFSLYNMLIICICVISFLVECTIYIYTGCPGSSDPFYIVSNKLNKVIDHVPSLVSLKARRVVITTALKMLFFFLVNTLPDILYMRVIFLDSEN